MSYYWIEDKIREFPAIATIAELLQTSGPQKVVIISHDDPDGIASAVLLARGLRKLNIRYEVMFPPAFELKRDEFETYMRTQRIEPDDIVFCLDKGLFIEYEAFAGMVRHFVVIDHHPVKEIPKHYLYLNPKTTIQEALPISNSHLIYMILAACGIDDDSDVFINLLGLTGDWAYKSVPERLSAWTSDFISQAKQLFPQLFLTQAIRPTWYDVEQRKVTSLLHQITELVSAVSGNGFQFFFHDRDTRLTNLDHPRFIFEQLLAYCDSPDVGKQTTLNAFIEQLPASDMVSLIFDFYLADWQKYFTVLQSAIEICCVNDVHIYFFIGNNVRLMPMLGSVKLCEMAKELGHQHALIMLMNRLPDRLNTSLRATGDRLHSGDICRELVSRLQSRTKSKKISGGGHPQAAEFLVSDAAIPASVTILEIMNCLLDLLTVQLYAN